MDSYKGSNIFLKYFFILIITFGSSSLIAEPSPYQPDKIDFNNKNASGLVDDLQTYALTVAKKYIKRYGSFTPFGVTLTIEGEYQLVIGSGKDAKKDLAMLLKSYRKQASKKEIVAAAIVYDTKLKEPASGEARDAIYLTLDSELTHSQSRFAFYKKIKAGHYKFNRMQARKIDRTSIFSASSASR